MPSLFKKFLFLSFIVLFPASNMAFAQFKNATSPLMLLPGQELFSKPDAPQIPNALRISLDDQGEYAFCNEQSGDNQLLCLGALAHNYAENTEPPAACNSKKGEDIQKALACLEGLGELKKSRSLQTGLLHLAAQSENSSALSKETQLKKTLHEMHEWIHNKENFEKIIKTDQSAVVIANELCDVRFGGDEGARCKKNVAESALEKGAIEACFSRGRAQREIYRCLQLLNNLHFESRNFELCKKAEGTDKRGLLRQDTCLSYSGIRWLNSVERGEVAEQVRMLEQSGQWGGPSLLESLGKLRGNLRGVAKVLELSRKDL